MTRLSVSRPTWSVPKYESASGGLFMRRKSALSGSRGATHGAVSARATMTNPTTPPAIERGLRRPKAASSRRAIRFIARSPPSSEAPADRLIADARIEPRVGEVDEDVDGHENQRVEQHEVLDNDDVALDYRDDEGATEARHAEGLLDGNRPAQHEAQQHARDRDHGQERVRQGVMEDDRSLHGTLCAGSAHVVLADDFEQTRARHPCDVRALGEAQHDCRAQDDLKILPWILPELDNDDWRLVAEPKEQRQDGEHAEPKTRNGNEEHGRRSGEAIGPTVGARRAEDAHGKPDQPGDDEREEGDLR